MAKGKSNSNIGRGVKDRGVDNGKSAGSKNASGAPGFKTVTTHAGGGK